MSIRLLLVDDNALFREGIAEILQNDGRFQVVGQASRGDEAVAAAASLQPDLILIDLQMPGMTGIEAIRQIRRRDTSVPIGVLTMFETQDRVRESLDAGANGYVAKGATPADLCEAAAALAGGTRGLVAALEPDASAAGSAGLSPVLAILSPRELEVLRALAGDAGNEAIAARLKISGSTLRNHIGSIYHKLGIHDRSQAVIVAVREGLVDVTPRRPPKVGHD
jgi:DNA-binding NarL/FixJ family response regulator